jgi:hypothetical protein
MRRYSQFGRTPNRDTVLPGVGSPAGPGGTTATPRWRKVFGAFAEPFAKRLQGVGAASGGGSSTLVADPGAYVVTGATATLRCNAVLVADPGAYVITGSSVRLHWSQDPVVKGGLASMGVG